MTKQAHDWLVQPSHKSMEAARAEIGDNKFDAATGSIVGVAIAALVLSLAFGMPNLDDLDWPIFVTPLFIGGVAGFFFGKTKDEQHHMKIRNRAIVIDSLNERDF